MKIQALTLVGLAAVASAISVSGEIPRREVQKNRFGAMEISEVYSSGMAKTVYYPQKKFLHDYERQTMYLQDSLKQLKINEQRKKDGRLFRCDNRMVHQDDQDPFYFFPVTVGDLTTQTNTVTYTNGMCFESLTFTYATTGDANDIGDVIVTVDAEKPRSLFCKDWFLFGNTEVQHVETFYFTGKHQITFKNLSPDAKIDMQKNGLKVFMFCDGYVDMFMTVFNTLLAFVGGMGDDPNGGVLYGSHIPEYMEKVNVQFLNDTMGYELIPREIQEYEYDESNLQSGDYLGIIRLDGLNPMIMYGSGTHAGHSTMALRFDGELYIVESQGGWYWPHQGIQRTKYADWIQYCKNADQHVVHFPLSPEARARFNETAAQEFFFATEGLPYGYHNFLFGWIDTPNNNWPPLVPNGIFPIVFGLAETMMGPTIDIFLNQALNKRLGTVGLNLTEIAVEASTRGMTIDDVMGMVEVEGWEYTGLQPRDGRAYVCSAYVAALYQAAGLFAPFKINGPEFTPKDVYSLNFFDTNFQKPAACQQADPNQPYCQILGKYRMQFPTWNTVSIYDHMNEKCPTEAPLYTRPDGC